MKVNSSLEMQRMRYGMRIVPCLLPLFIIFLLATSSQAVEVIRVGVAANFMQPFREIARSFENRNHCDVQAVFTSTGNLYGQIVNGAPYDLFLAADGERPALLHGRGLAEKPFVYAVGRVILWTGERNLCQAKDWKVVLALAGERKIALASPAISPYGASAVAALKKTGLWHHLAGRLVFAQDVTQVQQYCATGSIAAGFCALSAAFSGEGRAGCFFDVNEAPPVIQSACVLRGGQDQPEVRRFADFLLSPEAERIRGKYGYR